MSKNLANVGRKKSLSTGRAVHQKQAEEGAASGFTWLAGEGKEKRGEELSENYGRGKQKVMTWNSGL